MKIEIKCKYNDEIIKTFENVTGVTSGLCDTFLFEGELQNIIYPKDNNEYLVIIHDGT